MMHGKDQTGAVIRIEMKNICPPKKRVAAYARVSSGKDAMLHSLAAQVAYYSDMIQRNAAWKYVGVYADEALTGTKESRPEFLRLLEDCRAGKIDLILTKSLSRFARNTLTTLETVRELRRRGVDVWFERENIHTLSADGEFMLTILASFAQEESLSASENQKWKIRKNFEEGIPSSTTMTGYVLKDGVFVIIPEEAETVRMIFNDYLSGMGMNAIVRKLRKSGIKTKHDRTWHESGVRKILTNEKYTGDMLLQKCFRVDHITKRTVKNEGQLPQYYVEDAHEPIISKGVFEAVQRKLAQNAPPPSDTARRVYPFTGKILCEKCGKNFRRRTTAAGFRWACSTFMTYGKAYCDARQIPESVLEAITDGRAFKQIRVPSAGVVKVLWADGTETEHHFENPSRAESWTPQMRQLAKERRLQCLKNQ